MIDQKKVGLFIAKLRNGLDLTQEELAAKLYVGREAVSKWERGVTLPSHTVLLELSEVFDITINELLYGERINKKNKKAINTIMFEWINKITNKVNTKWKRIFTITILSAIFIYFISYFIFTYNSFKVFTTYASGENFTLKQGLIVICRDKMYLQFGDIINHSNEEINKIDLYYKNDNREVLLFSGSELADVIMDINNLKDMTEDDSLASIMKHLHFDIATKDNSNLVELDVDLDFKNTFLFKQDMSIIENTEKEAEARVQSDDFIDIDIDKVKSKFKLKKGEYIYEFKYEGVKYKCRLEENIIYITNDNLAFRYAFSSNEIIINKIDETIFYNISSKICKQGNCEKYMGLINTFVEKVLY